MNHVYQGLVILIVPAGACFAIFRGGRWRWRVIDDGRSPYFLLAFLNGLFWLGFFTALLEGLMRLLNLFP